MSTRECWAIRTQARDEVWTTVEISTTNSIGIVKRSEGREGTEKGKARLLSEILPGGLCHQQIGHQLLRRRVEHLAIDLIEHSDVSSIVGVMESFSHFDFTGVGLKMIPPNRTLIIVQVSKCSAHSANSTT